MSEGVIWLCSYPRSGNTWLRVFLANRLAGDEAAVALDSLHRYGLAWQDNLPALWECVTGSPRPDEAVQIARTIVPGASV